MHISLACAGELHCRAYSDLRELHSEEMLICYDNIINIICFWVRVCLGEEKDERRAQCFKNTFLSHILILLTLFGLLLQAFILLLLNCSSLLFQLSDCLMRSPTFCCAF